MGLRQCDKCSEMVDEAKAFCPACGHAFVEEQKRAEPSVFDSMDGTMQLGNTMYNQMLSDMGLNIAGVPNKAAEPVQPAVQPTVQPAVQPPVQQVLQPAVQVIQPAVQPMAQPAAEPAKPAGSNTAKWLIIAAVVVVLFFILLIVIGLIGFVVYTQYRSALGL